MIQRIHCRACSFWKAGTLSQQRYGTCQRYAPRPVAAGDDFEWARTLPDDWCGEAQPARIPHEPENDEPDWERNARDPKARVVRVHVDEWAERTTPLQGQPCPLAENGETPSCMSVGGGCGGWRDQQAMGGLGRCVLCIPPE